MQFSHRYTDAVSKLAQLHGQLVLETLNLQLIGSEIDGDFNSRKILNYDDLERFENEMTLDQRLPECSILDVL